MRRSPRPLFYVVLVLLLVLDQATKYWARTHLGAADTEFPGQGITVVPGFFDLIFARNTGIAFSLFTGNNLLWAVVAALFIGLAIWLAPRLDWRTKEMNLLLAALAAGALGNLLDRAIHGYVVDFLDFHWRNAHYPTFNIADSCITVSVLWICVRTFFGRRKATR